MIGGTVIQVVGHYVEVLDPSSFDRSWRKLDRLWEVKIGDELWWEIMGRFERNGYLPQMRNYPLMSEGKAKA